MFLQLINETMVLEVFYIAVWPHTRRVFAFVCRWTLQALGHNCLMPKRASNDKVGQHLTYLLPCVIP